MITDYFNQIDKKRHTITDVKCRVLTLQRSGDWEFVRLKEVPYKNICHYAISKLSKSVQSTSAGYLRLDWLMKPFTHSLINKSGQDKAWKLWSYYVIGVVTFYVSDNTKLFTRTLHIYIYMICFTIVQWKDWLV